MFLREKNEGAWKIGESLYFVMIRSEDGYDYSIYDKFFRLVDGGRVDSVDKSFYETFLMLLDDFELVNKKRRKVDYEMLLNFVERAGAIDGDNC